MSEPSRGNSSRLILRKMPKGAVMTRLASRKGELLAMTPDGKGRVRLDYRIPTRGLIGFRTEYLTATSGSGLIYHVFEKYDHYVEETLGQRNNGVLVSMAKGKALAYALFNLQERGRLMLGHGAEVYEGMILGIHSRQNDLVVNPTKAKQLNNIRAAGTDENLVLTPPVRYSLEQALEFIDDDELLEVTPEPYPASKEAPDRGRSQAGLSNTGLICAIIVAGLPQPRCLKVSGSKTALATRRGRALCPYLCINKTPARSRANRWSRSLRSCTGWQRPKRCPSSCGR